MWTNRVGILSCTMYVLATVPFQSLLRLRGTAQSRFPIMYDGCDCNLDCLAVVVVLFHETVLTI